MAGTFLGIYDTTAASNATTGTNSISVAEGMLPSNINNAFRDVMADIRQHYNNAEWIEYGDGAGTYTPTYVSSTSFTIDGVNVTTPYHVGRRVKVTASTPGTIYGSITATTFSTNTTVTVSWDSGSLSNEAITSVYIGVLAKTNNSIPTEVIGTTNIVADAVTNAKIADDQIDSEHYVDGSIDLAHLAASSVNSSKIVDDSIVNADINSSAAIDATKIANGTVTSAEFQYINTLSSNAQTQINTKAAITYVDDAVAGLRTRIMCEAASTANVTISSGLEAGDAIDGITLVSGDRVLLKNQSTASQNGVYLAVGSGAGAASRDPQFNTIAEISGQMVVINQGTANDNTMWLCTTNSDASLGSDSITFTKVTPQNVGDVTLNGTQTLTNKTLTSPKINEDVAVTSTATELNLLDGVSGLVQADLTKLAAVNSIAAELNIIDGDTSATGTTLVDADRLVVNDAGTMVQVAVSDVKTYLSSAGFSADDPTAIAIALG